MPGEDVDIFLKNFLGIDKSELEPNVRKGLVQTAQEHVYAYPHWDCVFAHFGNQPLAPETTPIPQGPIVLPAMPNHAGAVESDLHKALKRHVADNTLLVSAYGRFPKGVNEHPLRSGDRHDVFFHNASAMLAVEVNPADAPEPEIIRGVFQVVKYRAVLKAEQLIADWPPSAQAILALASKPCVKISLDYR